MAGVWFGRDVVERIIGEVVEVLKVLDVGDIVDATVIPESYDFTSNTLRFVVAVVTTSGREYRVRGEYDTVAKRTTVGVVYSVDW
jgi:hypothetical protein